MRLMLDTCVIIDLLTDIDSLGKGAQDLIDDKDFRQLVYTNRNHSIYGGNTRNHLFR